MIVALPGLFSYFFSMVHALESSFVKSIERLGSARTTLYDSDQQSKINQLLLEEDKLLKEKENLIKSSKPTDIPSPELNKVKQELQKVFKVKTALYFTLHNTTTDCEIAKSKVQSEGTVWRQKLDAMSSRNEILNNVVRLEKLLLLKNESIVEVENKTDN